MIMVSEFNKTMVVKQLHAFIEYNRMENKLLMGIYLRVNPWKLSFSTLTIVDCLICPFGSVQ